MDWIQAITIIGTLSAFIFWLFNKLDSDIKGVSDRLDKWIMHSTARMDSQSKRTDQLYQMFIDLLKEQKK